MVQTRHVLSVSLEDDLIGDIDYLCDTAGDDVKRSRAVELILRKAVPERKQSLSIEEYNKKSHKWP